MDATITTLVLSAEQGDRAAANQLFTTLYDELHRMARRELAKRGASVTLGATTLLHEAYLDISDREGAAFPDRNRFMGYAARVMRGLIIDYARRRQAQKRGGLFEITSIATDIVAALPADADQLSRLSDALDEQTIRAKALKSNPAERYTSLSEFANDLRHFLNNEPIGARPDSIAYRAAKFLHRNRPLLAATVAILVTLVGLVAYYTIQLTVERDRARLQADKASKVSELLTSLLTSTDPYRTPDAKEPTVQNLLDTGAERVAHDLNDQPELQAEMFNVIGRTYQRMGDEAKALPLLERALAIGRRTLGPDHVRLAQSLNDLGVLHRGRGHYTQAEDLLRESLAMRRRLLGSQNNEVAITLVELSRSLTERGRSDEAEPLLREALAIRTAVYGNEHRETATSKSDLGHSLMRRGDLVGAEPLLRQNVETTERLLGTDHANTAMAKTSLASLLIAKGDLAGAEAMLRHALDLNRRLFANKPIEYVGNLNTLALSLEAQGKLQDARGYLEECVRIARAQLPDDNPRVMTYVTNLARIRIAGGESQAVEATLRQILDARQRLYPADDWRIAQSQALLGASLAAQSRFADAEPLMRAADAGLKPIPGVQDRERRANRARLASLYESTGRSHGANAYR